jgi:hypothetical protein
VGVSNQVSEEQVSKNQMGDVQVDGARLDDEVRVIPLRPAPFRPDAPESAPRERSEPLWRDLVGEVLRRQRLAQERTLKEVADAARISLPYLSEVERGRKEASSEVLAAAAHALGLGLGDLLSLAQSELIRRGGAVRRTASHRAGGQYTGMCLAA